MWRVKLIATKFKVGGILFGRAATRNRGSSRFEAGKRRAVRLNACRLIHARPLTTATVIRVGDRPAARRGSTGNIRTKIGIRVI